MPKSYAFHVKKNDNESLKIIENIFNRSMNLSAVIRRLLKEFHDRGYSFDKEDDSAI